jgi:hypothetical protein
MTVRGVARRRVLSDAPDEGFHDYAQQVARNSDVRDSAQSCATSDSGHLMTAATSESGHEAHVRTSRFPLPPVRLPPSPVLPLNYDAVWTAPSTEPNSASGSRSHSPTPLLAVSRPNSYASQSDRSRTSVSSVSGLPFRRSV